MASSVLSSVKAINEEQEGASTQPRVVSLPVFDKSLCDGEGDRSPDTIKIEGPIDVFILEGWSMGFAPLSKKYLSERYDEAAKSGEKSHFSAHPLASLLTINDYLAEFASRVYPFFSTIVQIEPTSYENVFAWRLEQEHAMKSQNGGRGMTDEQVHGFVERYMPGYELWREGIWADNAPWAGRVLRLFFGGGREVIRITRPTQLSNTEDALASSSSTPAAPGPSTDSAGEKSRVEATPSSTQALRSSDLTHAPKSSSKTTGGPSSLPKSTTPYNPTWSRKFLAGKCPLNPTYDQIPSLATLHQDSLVTKCTPHLAFFPIQGPGGRLGVHPLKKKGRMALGGEGYLSGGTDLVDFAVEAFSGQDGARVALAGEDGVVRIWRLGEEGVQGPGSEPDLILKGESSMS